jgi:hypothetical protein
MLDKVLCLFCRIATILLSDYDIVQSVIITAENSTAHQFAQANKTPFELIENES